MFEGAERKQTVMACVFQSFYLSDWQGGCAFGDFMANSDEANKRCVLP
jgi:hypothetical protein